MLQSLFHQSSGPQLIHISRSFPYSLPQKCNTAFSLKNLSFKQSPAALQEQRATRCKHMQIAAHLSQGRGTKPAALISPCKGKNQMK